MKTLAFIIEAIAAISFVLYLYTLGRSLRTGLEESELDDQ